MRERTSTREREGERAQSGHRVPLRVRGRSLPPHIRKPGEGGTMDPGIRPSTILQTSKSELSPEGANDIEMKVSELGAPSSTEKQVWERKKKERKGAQPPSALHVTTNGQKKYSFLSLFFYLEI